MEKSTELLDDLDFVLKISTEMIIQSLDGKKHNSNFKEIRKCCNNLKISGVYDFDVNCNDQELLEQIQEFATHVNG